MVLLIEVAAKGVKESVLLEEIIVDIRSIDETFWRILGKKTVNASKLSDWKLAIKKGIATQSSEF